MEGDKSSTSSQTDGNAFQSTPSVWRVTGLFFWISTPTDISIHTLRVEGDVVLKKSIDDVVKFQSTPSVWRVTTTILTNTTKIKKFQSTPSVWRVTQKSGSKKPDTKISIHTLCVEGDSICVG